jgi:uncharacterized protein YndB with AHSA1/START domain
MAIETARGVGRNAPGAEALGRTSRTSDVNISHAERDEIAMNLPHRLDRTIVIQAAPATVFSFFTDSERWAAWWGPGSTIEPRAGGRVYIRHPGGIESAGEVVEIVTPQRFVFTYGFVSGKPIPPGASLVTVNVEPFEYGTRLRLAHEFAEATVRDEHLQGWRYGLSVFANVVTDLANANAAATVDAWFAVWSEPAAQARERKLSDIAAADVRFRDRFGLIDGISDLVPHIGAAQRFMPGVHLRRSGDVRHCQGTVLANWIAVAADGQERWRGSNVFVLRGDGRIEAVTGFVVS